PVEIATSTTALEAASAPADSVPKFTMAAAAGLSAADVSQPDIIVSAAEAYAAASASAEVEDATPAHTMALMIPSQEFTIPSFPAKSAMADLFRGQDDSVSTVGPQIASLAAEGPGNGLESGMSAASDWSISADDHASDEHTSGDDHGTHASD